MILSFKQFIESPRWFSTSDQLKKLVAEKSGRDRSIVAETELMLIFETSKQQTWLAANASALYCVIDRLSKSEPQVQWKIPRHEIIAGDKLLLSIRTEPKSESTGYVIIDRKKPRLYSRRLFSDIPIERRIRLFLLSALNVPI